MGPSLTHQVLCPSHPVGFMAPELCGTSSALLCPAGPKHHPKPPSSPCSAPREEHKQFEGNSWVDQVCRRKKAAKFSLGKFPAMLGTRAGLQVWALPPDLGSQVPR